MSALHLFQNSHARIHVDAHASAIHIMYVEMVVDVLRYRQDAIFENSNWKV